MKNLTDYNSHVIHFAILFLNLLYKFCWPLTRSRKTNVKISILFIFFLFLLSFYSFFPSFFFSVTHNSKTTRCIKILCIPNDCSANGERSYLFLSCVLATSGELQPWNCLPDTSHSHSDISLLYHTIIVGVSHICVVRLHLEYWARVLQAVTSLLGTSCV